MKTLLLFLVALPLMASAVAPDKKTLPIGLTPEEAKILATRGHARGPVSAPPQGRIHPLGEWEQAEAVMTLWQNPSLIAALAENGPVKILADSNSDKQSWEKWIKRYPQIRADRISYFVVPTDSIWVRDYGPWWIVDGGGRLGAVDTVYNRPRPNDDKVPAFVAKELGLPLYSTDLVHTGGNYYADGDKSAFSSTLVFDENSNRSPAQVLDVMLKYLGVERYLTTDLGKKVTIEHMDTFGKLVAPDTYVVAQFPANSRFAKDADELVRRLSVQQSPYGTPYRVFRLPMIDMGGEEYRAYINSFVSNGAIFFPSYGDQVDGQVAAIYRQALPGFKVVPVDNGGTEWGDSVHCRTRNIVRRDVPFVFPSREGSRVRLETFPSSGATLSAGPLVFVSVNGGDFHSEYSVAEGEHLWSWNASNFAHGDRISLYFEVTDSLGHSKRWPFAAPAQSMNFVIE